MFGGDAIANRSPSKHMPDTGISDERTRISLSSIVVTVLSLTRTNKEICIQRSRKHRILSFDVVDVGKLVFPIVFASREVQDTPWG